MMHVDPIRLWLSVFAALSAGMYCAYWIGHHVARANFAESLDELVGELALSKSEVAYLQACVKQARDRAELAESRLFRKPSAPEARA